MNQTARIRIAALTVFLGIALGAFGAHLLESTLIANDRVATWDTAVLYHLIHGVAMFALALGIPKGKSATFFLMLAGILIFSGSLYVLSLTGITKLGAITPIGGLAFLIAWGILIVSPTPKS